MIKLKPVFLYKVKIVSRIAAVVLFAVYSLSLVAQGEPITVTYRVPMAEGDDRFNYETELLRLGLEKSKDKYGDYNLVKGLGMNFPRTLSTVKSNQLENFFFKTSYSVKLNEEFSYVPLPVDLGIVGYRVCFVSRKNIELAKSIDTLEKLKKYSIGQGRGWTDVGIMRHNGLHVVEVPKYKSLFPMVAASRFYFLCRGANELKTEWEANKDLKNFAYDSSFVIFYPLPRYFWTNKLNTQAIERLHYGLQIAFDDGSMHEVWRKHYQQAVDFSKLNERRVFKLENPGLDGVVPGFEKYFYNPFK